MSSCGGYPMGADNDPRAPWNETDEVCARCHGTGKIYLAWDCVQCKQIEVSENEYLLLPDDEDEGTSLCKDYMIDCRECDGNGYRYYDGYGRLKY